MKTLIRTLGIVIVSLAALIGTGCNVEWSSHGTLAIDACRTVDVGRPVETCYPAPLVVERPCVVVERPHLSAWHRPAPAPRFCFHR